MKKNSLLLWIVIVVALVPVTMQIREQVVSRLGGAIVQTSASPTPTPSASVTPSLTPTPSSSSSASPTPTSASSASPSPTPTAASSISPSLTPTPSSTSSASPTPTSTSSVSPSPSASTSPTTSASPSPGTSSCQLIQAGDVQNVPADFSYPWDVAGNSNDLLLRVTCYESNVELQAGTGGQYNFIWPDAYLTKKAQDWEKIPLSGPKNQDWIFGNGSAVVTMTADEFGMTNYAVIYQCSWDETNFQWQCGCRDKASCGPVGKWTLQSFRKGN